MRPKSLVLLLLALGCGLVASIGISEIIDNRDADKSGIDTEAILVAKVDIERNTVFSAENLALTEWPKSTIPEGAIREISELEGRRPTHKIAAGVPVLQGMLGIGDGIMSVTSQIPKGYRVVSVRVTDESSAANMIRPGDRVDVQVYLRANERLGIHTTSIRTFLKDVSVFAVNSEIRSDIDSDQPIQARTISLLVTPEQGAKVTLATEVGTIRLVLRAAQDDTDAGETVVDIGDILGESDEAELATSTEPAKDSPARKSMFDWLEEQKNSFQKALASRPVVQATPASTEGPWRMIVHRGNEVSVEEFQPGALTSETIATGAVGSSLRRSAAPIDRTTSHDDDADAFDADDDDEEDDDEDDEDEDEDDDEEDDDEDDDGDDEDVDDDDDSSSSSKGSSASDPFTNEKAKELGKKLLDALDLGD